MNISNCALLDSNVLVYAADKSSPYHKPSKELRERGLTGEILLCVCPQVLTEFLAVVTDSRRVKNPISPSEAIKEVEKYLTAPNILKIYQNEVSFRELVELIGKYKIGKQEVFDLQLVSTMLTSKISKIYTFNTSDFSKFKEIKILSPN